MSKSIEFRNIVQLTDIAACHAIIVELRPHLTDANSFLRQVMRQREQGYRLTAAWCGGQIVGLVGYRLQENLLYGRFVYVDDLVVLNPHRNDGIGAKLLSLARAYAIGTNCGHLVLDTGLHKALAQRFYFRHGLLANSLGFCETFSDCNSKSPTDDLSAMQLKAAVD